MTVTDISEYKWFTSEHFYTSNNVVELYNSWLKPSIHFLHCLNRMADLNGLYLSTLNSIMDISGGLTIKSLKNLAFWWLQ